jgi:hypothetical protein
MASQIFLKVQLLQLKYIFYLDRTFDDFEALSDQYFLARRAKSTEATSFVRALQKVSRPLFTSKGLCRFSGPQKGNTTRRRAPAAIRPQPTPGNELNEAVARINTCELRNAGRSLTVRICLFSEERRPLIVLLCICTHKPYMWSSRYDILYVVVSPNIISIVSLSDSDTKIVFSISCTER